MIAVVADDLTGAAELAGIAWSYGLTAEVQTEFSPQTTANVVAVDANSRDVDLAAATKRVQRAFEVVQQARPVWTYKKCDSVLRGHVPEEIAVALQVTGCSRACLVPANPSRGRVIRSGEYFVGDKPLVETPFAQDPHHPRLTMSVDEMLAYQATLIRSDEPLGAEGIFVPEVTSAEQMSRRAKELDYATLPVGAADFFEALLTHRTAVKPREIVPRSSKARRTLLLCCSSMAWSAGRDDECRRRGVPVLELDGKAHWREILRYAQYEYDESSMVMVGSRGRVSGLTGREIDEVLKGPFEVASELTFSGFVDRILIEGGGTARKFLDEASRSTRFPVARQIVPGVVELGVREKPPLSAIVKVGSYPWPEDVWPESTAGES